MRNKWFNVSCFNLEFDVEVKIHTGRGLAQKRVFFKENGNKVFPQPKELDSLSRYKHIWNFGCDFGCDSGERQDGDGAVAINNRGGFDDARLIRCG